MHSKHIWDVMAMKIKIHYNPNFILKYKIVTFEFCIQSYKIHKHLMKCIVHNGQITKLIITAKHLIEEAHW